jgi:hypothetical protein
MVCATAYLQAVPLESLEKHCLQASSGTRHFILLDAFSDFGNVNSQFALSEKTAVGRADFQN